MTEAQAAVYAEVSEALDVEGYGDLLKGQPIDVRDALAQMELDAVQMHGRALRLKTLLDDADDDAALTADDE